MKLLPHEVEAMQDEQENWGLDFVRVKELWNQGITGKGSVIAVIDTGCDLNHESLAENIIGGANFTNDYSANFTNYQDNNGHGTHVAGIIASNNKVHSIGVAPSSKLLILKALSYSGGGSITSVIRALYYAASWRGANNEGVDIVCLSLGTPKDNPLLKEAIQYLITKNILVVVASGNDGDGSEVEEYRYPGFYNEVIQVGSIEKEMVPAYYSNNNNEIDLVAPGSAIFSTFINNGYRTLSGTSMAAPFVAGALALIKEQGLLLFNRSLSEAEMYGQLVKSTNFLSDYVAFMGNGVLDLSKAFR